MATKVKVYHHFYSDISCINYVERMQDSINKNIAELEKDGNIVKGVSTDTIKADYKHGNYYSMSTILYESGDK